LTASDIPLGRAITSRCYAAAVIAKPQPNHRVYLEALRRLTAEQRLIKAFELTEMSRALFRVGLRQRFPKASDDELRRIYLERLDLCHNRPS
jgi:hypothetical protein